MSFIQKQNFLEKYHRSNCKLWIIFLIILCYINKVHIQGDKTMKYNNHVKLEIL